MEDQADYGCITHGEMRNTALPKKKKSMFPNNWRNTVHCDKQCIDVKVNHLTPNGHYMGRTAQLTSRCCILYIYSTNVRIEYFKHAA